ncbi:MAG: dethiobiotin synthase [Gammaproteobacteria bacterium]|nr:dethiobiotin synthase [Gammaproteobacteria bacterium]
MKGYFITGTDTDVGKTVVTAGLVEAFNKRGTPTVGLKPVATGSEGNKKGMSPDTEFLMKNAKVELPKEEVTIYSFAPPVSPHIAAVHADARIEMEKLVTSIKKTAKKVDMVIVEGVGGWLVPLNESETVADLAVALQLPVIVVVSIKLGCINHAALTMDAIRGRGLKIAGWVANLRHVDTPNVPDVINTLVQNAADAPMLGIIPPMRSVTPVAAARHINLDLLV